MNQLWIETPVRGHTFEHNGVNRTAVDAWQHKHDADQPFLRCTQCGLAVHWNRRQVLEHGVNGLPEGRGACPGNSANINALITATEEDLQIWRISEPDNPHNIEVVRNELRWRCVTCSDIGGPIFHMDHHDPARAQRGVQTAARPHTLVTVKRFRNLVRTACVLHELPERKT